MQVTSSLTGYQVAKSKLKILAWSVAIVVAFIAVLIGAIAGGLEDEENSGVTQLNGVTPAVMRFKEPISEEMKKQGLDQKWLNLVLAHVMQESGGRAEQYPDIFQASESLGKAPNSLTTSQSIVQGVAFFKKQLQAVKEITGHEPSPTNEGDVNISSVLYQAPAFGQWLKTTYNGKWSVKANNDFYENVLPKYGQGSGDKNYYKNILKYYNIKSGGLNDATTIGIGNAKGAQKYYSAIMTEAKKYEGRAYVWGGSNPLTGFDCSGLVQWSYAKAGINLPRTSQEQWNAVQHISAKELKPGDLIFFSGTNPSQSGMTHVGIYMGDGKMYNAQDNGVRVDNLSDWTALYSAYYGRVNS